MKTISSFTLIVILSLTPVRSFAFWGGNPADTMYLAKILANSIRQLVQMKQMLKTARNDFELIRNINSGIDQSLRLIQTLNPELDPGIYEDWRKVSVAVEQLEQIYGIVVDSPLTRVQKDLDQVSAEAITRNNSIFEYTKRIDQIGEQIKSYSKVVSPKGAQKLTAQSMGVVLHVMNESLRAQATGLKLQAQSIASQNKKDKDNTRQILKTSDDLKSLMKGYDPKFEVPRFN